MTASTWAWLAGLIGLTVGCAAGFFFSRFGTSEARKRLDTERRLQESDDQLQAFREEVSKHFQTTAELVNRLSRDYRDVHNHLADGAGRLCVEAEEPPLLQALPEMAPESLTEAAEQLPSIAAAPLDYAPRSAEQPGVLREDYGFEKSSN